MAIVEDSEQASYSTYFDSLLARGYDLSIAAPSAWKEEDDLFVHGERMYDHIVMLAPHLKKLPTGLEPQTLVEFLQKGGNMLVALSPQLTEAWRDFAREFGLDFGERGMKLVDHFGYDTALDLGDHSAVRVGGNVKERGSLAAGGIVPNAAVFSDKTRMSEDSLLFRGIAHWVGPNPLAFPLLLPPLTAYQSDVPKVTGEPSAFTASNINKLEALHDMTDLLTGADAHSEDATASLASAVQLRDNSARAVFVGSLELFQNDLYGDASRPLQRSFVDDLTAWTFQESSVLRIASNSHQRVRLHEHDVRPDYEEQDNVVSMYRIKDIVKYALTLEAFDGARWGPAPNDLDLQLSAIMLDPYVTEPLHAVSSNANSTTYTTTLRLPDRHGVFTLRVNWKRPGWTYIRKDDVIPVRPFNHDEYPRMVSSSWPYISGALSTMTAFVVFVALWFTLPVTKAPVTKTKKQ
ncbi:oligosaccharyl transferase glycoprotein complex, beta subunit [Malassezia pachydermatis]|uniref:Dolichyl-diphosphooligosaccharide--protein glycosyltransferase subunit WBP1 n=1 Tax=Malassezia pachydermatis TaxID=77020 RepID=A0A0M8MT54_9BASI|nr:wbp1-oligosaccharyl transferase beta subunit precursor [Malassezia pachydermatis]KOS16237.1 wbp1-oligosaccharyl transferase beta subunit precursor [Malassezia pachydermatis]